MNLNCQIIHVLCTLQSDSTSEYLRAAREGQLQQVVSALDSGRADVSSANSVRTSDSDRTYTSL